MFMKILFPFVDLIVVYWLEWWPLEWMVVDLNPVHKAVHCKPSHFTTLEWTFE